MTEAFETATAFLSIGGRLMLNTVGDLSTGLDAAVLFSLDLSDEEAERRMTIAKALDAEIDHDREPFTHLVNRHGRETDNGWVVWENLRTGWDRAYGVYTRARAYSDGLPDGDPAEDRAVDSYCAAMDRVIAAPAPDLEALAVKIDFMRERECYADDWLEISAADARRLHAEGR